MRKRRNVKLPEDPNASPGVSLSKLDVARRQLDTAILLYFRDGDAVSIHTLAAAAYEIIAAVNRKMHPNQPMLSERMVDLIKPEYQDDFRNRLKEAQNFFKHGSRDPLEALAGFSPEQSELVLLDACLGMARLTEEKTTLCRLFAMWARLTFAKSWLAYRDEPDLNATHIAAIAKMPRNTFFDHLLPIMTTLGNAEFSIDNSGGR